jgi:tetratricopeptide (TPR) repeat protein
MAFLSYSHQDTEVADWLHETLEQFRVPPRLVGTLTELGPIPKRLTPIFRDRHELAAAPDLGEEIKEAIAGSRFQIVLCSPAAAKSRWINEEIDCFKRIHRQDRVLAVIVDGEPFASDIPGREDEECFPPALRTHYDARGRPTCQRAEPIAADLREQADGRRMGMLKLAAGMLGVGLDDLVQREAQRRHRRLYAITAASVAGMIVTSGLAYTAIEARDEARDQRREAEGLIGFMLGDLRKKLEPVGRLDVLDSVGVRALKYYEGQDKQSLSDESLAQRSRALTLMGEMAQARGDLDGALRRYQEAMASTAELARRAPNNPQNLFNHAQNVFWVGYIDYEHGQFDKAAAAFREYRRLADRMIALAPDNADYRLERIYADTNLGTVLMALRRYREAADTFQGLLDPAAALQAGKPVSRDYRVKLINTLAWLADAREFSGQIDEAMGHRQRQLTLISQLWNPDKPDTSLKRDELTARRSIARMRAYRGQMALAVDEARQASAVVGWLTATEPQNTEWMQAGAQANFDRAGLELAAGRINDARTAAQAACSAASQLLARDSSVTIWRTRLQLRCLRTKASIALRSGEAEQAVDLTRRAVALARTEKNATDRAFAVASAELALGSALAASGQPEAARGAYQRAQEAWPAKAEETPAELANHAILLRRLGRTREAAPISKQLSAIGYRHPDYLGGRQQGG